MTERATTRPRRRADLALVAVGGAAVFASLFLPWHLPGAARGVSGYRLLDVGLALRRGAGLGPPVWLLVLGYLVPLCGAAALVSLAAGRRRAAAVARIGLAVGAVAVTLVAQARLVWDLGPVVALCGAALIAAGGVLTLAGKRAWQVLNKGASG